MLENTGNIRKMNPILINGVSSGGVDVPQLADLTRPSEGLVVQYLRLGFHAMALQEARKLHRQNDSVWGALRLAQAAENAGNHDEARLAAQCLLIRHDEPEGYEFLARHAARADDWSSAADLLLQYLAVYPDDVQAQARYCWLGAIAGRTVTDRALKNMEVSGEWPAKLRTFLVSNPASIVAATRRLIARAECSTEKSEAHFYAAFKFWRAGMRTEAGRHLCLARQEGSQECEYGWAPILLRAL